MTRYSLLTMTAVAAIAFSGLPGVSLSADQSAPAAQQTYPSIYVTSVIKRTLTDRIVASGTIRPVDEVLVQPLVEGLSILELKADAGDKVEAGQVLATLNADQLLLTKTQTEATRAKALAGLEQVKAQLVEARTAADESVRQRDRALKLGDSGTISSAQVEQLTAAADSALARVRTVEQAIAVSQADIKLAESQIADIDLRLHRTDVKSPVAGIVSTRNAKVGAIASGAAQPLFTVIRDGALELVADVSESDILKLKEGQKAKLALAGSKVELAGHIRLVSPTIDQVTRLGSVRIAIDADPRARSGMYATATITVDSADGDALPITAITSNSEGTTVRKVEDGVVKLMPITTGIQDKDYIQITGGLKAGDTVVARAGAYVRDGDHITPVPDKGESTN